ncbi:MAG: hypothetical protein NTZ64_03065 [Polaromonas sp.]|nr:hypothetical protein [Polaromonas sp.]
MTAYLLINHLLNFIAPAAFTALMLGLLSRFFAGFFGAADAQPPHWAQQVALNFAIGVGVLLAGLVLLGRDGKMLTYLLLMLSTATSQWWQLGGNHDCRERLKKLATRQR